MDLSHEIISQFAKIVNNDKKQNIESTIYGTVVDDNGNKYVKPDGSDQLIPITENDNDIIQGSTTANTETGDRVSVLIKNHTATVTGNISSPSTNNKEVDTKISEANVIIAKQIQAEKAYLENIIADKASIGELKAAEAKITNLETDKASVEELNAAKAKIDNLEATKIDADVVEAEYATIKSLEVVDAKVGSIDAEVADINTLMFGSATGNILQTTFANAVIALLGDAQIKSAMIESLNASKINAGSVNTNNVKIESTDGKLVISDNTIQISDDKRVRVQIGKDASNDYSISIWDADGNLMFSEGGITDSAIKESIIRNDMVSDDANIDAKKLDIDSLFTEINGSTKTIKSTKVYFDSQEQTLDMAFNEMNTTVTEQGETIESQGTDISVIQGQIESKIWQQDIDTATNEQSTKYSKLEQDLSGFKTTVSETATKLQENIDTVSTDLANFSNDTLAELSNLQDQIDGSIMTWFYAYVPTDSNEPANTWNTTDLKNQHLGDLFYDLNTGYCYRWQVSNQEYSWQLVKDADVTKALEDAAKAQDTADSKRRVFSSTPKPPYEVGDLWSEGSSGDLKRCKVTRLTGSFYASDWELATKYTDDTAVDNLEVGGRNLLRFTSDLPLTYDLNTGISSYDTAKPLSDTVDGIRFDVPEDGRGGINVPLVFDGAIQNGENVTISFDYRGTLTDTGAFYFLQRTSPNVSVNTFPDAVVSEEEWQHYTYTFSSNYANERTCYSALLFYMGSTEAGKWIEIKKGSLKLERGNKATDWTPAPEDMATADDLVATETILRTSVSNIEQETNKISLSVSSLESDMSAKFGSVSNDINTLRNEVELRLTPEAVEVQIQQAMADGVSKVNTGTGFTLDETGFTVKKIDHEGNVIGETSTTITENGMVIKDNTTSDEERREVLTANKDGVNAKNLHATTYLIIGKDGRSRFEDYTSGSTKRTGCFWIGG